MSQVGMTVGWVCQSDIVWVWPGCTIRQFVRHHVGVVTACEFKPEGGV